MKASKKSISTRLAAILLALCMCVGGVAATTTPAYAAASAADTGGGYYVAQPGYLFMSNLSATKTFTLRWKAVSGASGYQVQVSKYSDFSSLLRSVTVGSSTTSSTFKITSPGYYYFRVRAYVTINGTRYYSSWTRASATYKW